MASEKLTIHSVITQRGSEGVYSVAPTDTVEQAAREMQLHNISGISVIAKGKLVGFISEKDISHVVAQGDNPVEITVEDVMATDLVTVDINTPLWDTAKDMLDNKLRHLPVLQDGQPHTTIAMRDVLALMIEFLGTEVQHLRGEVDWIKYMQGD